VNYNEERKGVITCYISGGGSKGGGFTLKVTLNPPSFPLRFPAARSNAIV